MIAIAKTASDVSSTFSLFAVVGFGVVGIASMVVVVCGIVVVDRTVLVVDVDEFVFVTTVVVAGARIGVERISTVTVCSIGR